MRGVAPAAGAAFAGALLLAALFPRVDPSASIRSALDRPKAIQRARQLTLRYGLDASMWHADVWDQVSEKHRAYLEAHPDDPAGRLLQPLTVTVVLNEPGGNRRVSTSLFPDGSPSEWRLEMPAGIADNRASIPLAEVLRDFVGKRLDSFGQPVISEHEGVVHGKREWGGQLTASIETDEKGGLLRGVKLSPTYPDEFNRSYDRNTKTSPAVRAANIFRALAWIPAMIGCFWQIARRRFQFRVPVTLFCVQLAWALVSFWGSTYYQQLRDMWPRTGGTVNINPGITNYGWDVWAAMAFFTLFAFSGAGRVMAVAGNGEKWLTLELAARGRLRNRAVGRSLASGLLGGIGIAALPYVGAVAFRSTLPFHSVDALVAPVPLVVAVRCSAMVLPVMLFGFVFPLTGYLRKPVIRLLVFLPLALLLTAAGLSPRPLPAFGTGVLLLGAYLLVYLRVDLLAAMAAAVAARFVVVPWVLLLQPAGSLRQSGLALLGLGIAVLAACLHTALRAPERDVASEGISGEVPYGPAESDRERLEAEFEVARRAQQAALPTGAPAPEGYSLAASCEPARQVGGDLYDFFQLPDGRLGITVADVSGKGVPAALYMMVTKGLLTAVSRDSADLPQILQQVNLHLYRACRRTVFVTMAAVALDCRRRSLQYGRAGHNPMVWRRASRGQTILLKPRGLGLGMTPNEAFKRHLEIDELSLEPGDAIVLYSDGVTEAVNGAMDQYGEERLLRIVEGADGQPALATRDAILSDLAQFMGTTPARDDITVVVLRAGATELHALNSATLSPQ